MNIIILYNIYHRGLNIEDEEELANLNGNLNMYSYKIVKKLEKKVGS